MAYETVIFVVLALGVVFFGAKKMPELARSLGKAQSEFEKAKIQTMRAVTNNDTVVVINREELEEAAKAAGIEKVDGLSNDELRKAILKNLD